MLMRLQREKGGLSQRVMLICIMRGAVRSVEQTLQVQSVQTGRGLSHRIGPPSIVSVNQDFNFLLFF